jgi:hypothetical protein
MGRQNVGWEGAGTRCWITLFLSMSNICGGLLASTRIIITIIEFRILWKRMHRIGDLLKRGLRRWETQSLVAGSVVFIIGMDGPKRRSLRPSNSSAVPEFVGARDGDQAIASLRVLLGEMMDDGPMLVAVQGKQGFSYRQAQLKQR